MAVDAHTVSNKVKHVYWAQRGGPETKTHSVVVQLGSFVEIT